MKYTLLSFLLLSSLVSFAQKDYRFPPRNEVRQDSSLKVFVDTLKAAIARKDAPALLKCLSPSIEIYMDAEADNNIKGFVKEYKPADTAAMIWGLLKKITDLGGVFSTIDPSGRNKDEFIFPYAAELGIKHEYCVGCFTCIATIAPDVNVRAKPDRLSAAVGKLNYHAVKVIQEPVSKLMGGNSENWVYIQTFDHNITGWIRRDLVWDSCNYRMYITRTKGKWQVTTLVAGD